MKLPPSALLILSISVGCGAPDVQADIPVRDEVPPPADPAPPVDVDPLADPTYRRAATRGGTYLVLWKPVEGEVPKNRHFELDVVVYRVEAGDHVPLSDANLAFSGWMPDHGHGMIRRPQARPLGEGRYRVRGMLFHMGGFWQFFVDVIDAAHSERAQFDLLL